VSAYDNVVQNQFKFDTLNFLPMKYPSQSSQKVHSNSLLSAGLL